MKLIKNAEFGGERPLFEYWEDGGKSLLVVTSNPAGLDALEPGDVIVKRTWAAVGEPAIYNQAALKARS
jgi:hypothetical protein